LLKESVVFDHIRFWIEPFAIRVLPYSTASGMVHAWVGQNITPLTNLKVIFAPFFTYDELVTSRVHPQQHKQPTNTTTMVMEPLAPPAVWTQ
jgi:hypothetical protein